MKRRAMSLLEAVVTVALLTVIFLLLAELLQGAVGTLTFSKAKDRARAASGVGLDRVCSELREALKFSPAPPVVAGPNPTPSGPDLWKVKTDPSLVRFPLTPPAVFDPLAASGQVKVHFYLDSANQLFLRDVCNMSGAVLASMPIAESVTGFGCCTDSAAGSPQWNQTIYLSLSVQEKNRVETFLTEVHCAALQP
jgi:hypothetical protein